MLVWSHPRTEQTLAGRMDDFSKYKIKDYKYWSVFLHKNQDCLGRCYVWCNRENALDLADVKSDEQKEFFLILQDLKKALQKIFQPDWFNYAFLGNETKHLHGHLLPRYATPREFEGIVFKDETYGHSHKTNHNFYISDEIVERIRIRIREVLVN